MEFSISHGQKQELTLQGHKVIGKRSESSLDLGKKFVLSRMAVFGCYYLTYVDIPGSTWTILRTRLVVV